MGKRSRVFVRGVTSETYGLSDLRRSQLAAERVRGDDVIVDDGSVAHSADSDDSRTWWRIAPGDDPFLTQTLQVHFVELPGGTSNAGHGHQNEAAFYILEGAGYEIHDGRRYDWTKGDLVLVHGDSHHQHFNPYPDKAVALVMKAKCSWMFLGLIQQGRSGPVPDESRFGPRADWSQLWTDGVEHRKKVISTSDATWETTPLGRVRDLCSAKRDDVRQFGIDVFELGVPTGSRSGKRWQMADEVLYVVEGAGHALHWEVEAEIDDRYYARIANEPSRHEFKTGDTVYVPQNTISQLVNPAGQELRVVSAQNRLIKHLGYDKVAYLEHAPEYDEIVAASPVAASAVS